MEGREDLLKDFYSKYAPEQQVDEARLSQVNEFYGDDDVKLINDLYTKYAPKEVIDEGRLNDILDYYSLKKKEATTEESQTPSEPLQESGQEVDTTTDVVSDDVGAIKIQEPTKLKPLEYKEEPFFTGAAGDVLKAIDSSPWLMGLGVGDFVDDIGRAIFQGSKQGDVVSPALTVATKGTSVSDEELEQFIVAYQDMLSQEPSKEMVDFQKTYTEGGEDVSSFMKGLWENPSVVPQIVASSMASMVNKASLSAAGGTAATFTAGGAVGGGGVGAIVGLGASVPFAFAAAGATLEGGLYVAEAIGDELGDKEWTKENVRAILQDEQKLNEIRKNAALRGATIGVIDAATGKLAGTVGAKLASGSRVARFASIPSATGVEMVGGSAGEASARALTGQEQDVAEVMFEGVAEGYMGVVNTMGAKLGMTKPKPKYLINGEPLSKVDFDEIINTAKDSELRDFNVKIENDPDSEAKLYDRVKNFDLETEIKQANKGVSDSDIPKLVELEKELQSLSNNETEAAKQKRSEIKGQIRDIVNKPKENAEETTQVREQGQEIEGGEVGMGDMQGEPQQVEEANVQTEEKVEISDEEITQESGVQPTQEEQATAEEAAPAEETVEPTEEERKSRVNNEIDGIVEKVKKRGVKEDTNPQVVADAVIPYLQGSKLYEDMNDTQREDFYRETMSRLGFKGKKAPSASKVLGKIYPEPKKGFTTKQLLKMAEEQDKRGIREGKKQEVENISTFSERINNSIKGLPKGTLTTKQASQLVRAAKGVRTPSQIKRYEDVATRIIDDAEYALKLSEADAIRSKIEKRSKGNYPSNLTKAMSDFAKIDPSSVPNIDQYISYANETLNLTQRASYKKGELQQPKKLSVSDIYSDYIDRHNSLSDDLAKKSILSDYSYLTDAGIISDDMSVDELNTIIDSIYSDDSEAPSKDNQNNTSLEKLVDFKIMELKSIPKASLSSKAKEQIDILESSTIEGIGLTRRELGELYLYLENFIQNGKLNNISSITSKLVARTQLNEYLASGNTAKTWISKIRGLATSFLNITQLLEAITGSERASAELYKASSIYDFASGKTKALNRYSEFVKEFSDTYIKKKTKELHSVKDRAERMIFGFLSQAPLEQYQDALDFVDSSIKYYEEGRAGVGSKEVGDEARKIFEEKYRGTKSSNEVDLSPMNKRMLGWFRSAFASIKPEYFENAEIVHNRTLEEKVEEGLYLPFIFKAKKKTRDSGEGDSIDNPPSFLDNKILPNRSGSTNKRENVFNSDTRYMPLDFERSMMFKLEEQLMDIETSFPIKKIAAFFNERNSVDAIGTVEMEDAFRDRIKEYVQNSYSSYNLGEAESAAFDVINFLSNMSGRVSLGSVDQVLKQTIPVILNVMTVAGVNNTLESLAEYSKSKDVRKVFKNSPVNRRSYSDQDLNKIYSEIPESTKKNIRSKFTRAFKITDELADKLMMTAIQEGDKVAAQVSWMAYYKKYMGDNFSSWESESKSPNKTASAYADLMVSNTQNVNDIEMQAKILSSGTKGDMSWKLISVARRNALPFISFAGNQLADEVIQFSKLGNLSNMREPITRLGGRLGEQIAFIGIRKSLYMLYGAAASSLLGSIFDVEIADDEDDDNLKKFFYDWVTTALLQFTVLYGHNDTIDSRVAKGLNRLYYNEVLSSEDRAKYGKYNDKFIAKIKDPKKKKEVVDKMYQKFEQSGDAPVFDPSLFGNTGGVFIGLNNHYSGIRDFYNALSAEQDGDKFTFEYTTAKGYELEKELTDNEIEALVWATALENTDILLPRDIATLGRRAKGQILFQKKRDEIERKKRSK